ncbi:hypothetical protein VPH35_038529 [Triticum aestivum]
MVKYGLSAQVRRLEVRPCFCHCRDAGHFRHGRTWPHAAHRQEPSLSSRRASRWCAAQFSLGNSMSTGDARAGNQRWHLGLLHANTTSPTVQPWHEGAELISQGSSPTHDNAHLHAD